MRIYLDVCALNREFDDQAQTRIATEAVSVKEIRKLVENGSLSLVWSYIHDVEISRNPFEERKIGATSWSLLSAVEIGPSIKIASDAVAYQILGFNDLDSLHLACAIEGKSDYFITTDDGILRKSGRLTATQIIDPIALVKIARKMP